MEQFFEILGIEPTKDEAAIAAAYRKQLPLHHPEDDQEGFQKLREAYDKAREYARIPDEGEGNLGDLSPRAAEILESVDFIAAEDTRVTLKLLNHLGIKKQLISL